MTDSVSLRLHNTRSIKSRSPLHQLESHQYASAVTASLPLSYLEIRINGPQRTTHNQHSVCTHEQAHTHTHTEPLNVVGTSRWGAEAASCLLCDFTEKETHSEENHLPWPPEQQQHWDLVFRQIKACTPCGLLDPSFRGFLMVFKCPKSLLERCCSFDVFSKDEWACHTSPASVRSYLHRWHGGLGVNALFAEGKISPVCKSKHVPFSINLPR